MPVRTAKKTFEPSAAAKLARELRTQRGWSQDRVAEAMGVSQPEIARLERGERKFTIQWAIAYGRVFEIDPAAFTIDEPNLTKSLTNGAGPRQPRRLTLPVKGAEEGPAIVIEERDLPIRGHAQGGSGRVFLLPVDQVDHGVTYRPPILKGVRGAYALWVFEDSMHPMYKHGHLIWVHPHMPAKPGDGVVIVRQDDSVMVKELVRRHNGTVTLRQYRPQEEEFDIPAADVKEMHRVVGTFDDR